MARPLAGAGSWLRWPRWWNGLTLLPSPRTLTVRRFHLLIALVFQFHPTPSSQAKPAAAGMDTILNFTFTTWCFECIRGSIGMHRWRKLCYGGVGGGGLYRNADELTNRSMPCCRCILLLLSDYSFTRWMEKAEERSENSVKTALEVPVAIEYFIFLQMLHLWCLLVRIKRLI